MRSKLQKKPSSNKREHSALQNIKLLHFFYFWVIFALLDLDPDLLDKNQCRSRSATLFIKYLVHFSLWMSVLRIRIRDPGLGAFLTPGSGIRDPGWEKVSIGIRDPGSGMNNPDHIFLELRNHFFAFFGVKILKFFDEDPGSGMETVRIRDPGWKKVGSGIRDKHPGSATLVK